MSQSQSAQSAVYEQDMIEMMMKMNEDMSEFAGQDLMSDHAYNQLSMLQKDQVEQIKTMFGHINALITSEYFQKKVAQKDKPLRKKRQTEAAKRAACRENPQNFHICPCCDSVFKTEWNLKRHRLNALKCSVIKCSKKGALEQGNHRAPQEISDYIDTHFEDDDSDEEINEQQEQNFAADLADEHAAMLEWAQEGQNSGPASGSGRYPRASDHADDAQWAQTWANSGPAEESENLGEIVYGPQTRAEQFVGAPVVRRHVAMDLVHTRDPGTGISSQILERIRERGIISREGAGTSSITEQINEIVITGSPGFGIGREPWVMGNP